LEPPGATKSPSQNNGGETQRPGDVQLRPFAWKNQDHARQPKARNLNKNLAIATSKLPFLPGFSGVQNGGLSFKGNLVVSQIPY